MKQIPVDGAGKLHKKMAAQVGNEIRLAWKPKGTSWLGVTLNFQTHDFSPKLFKSQRAAAKFVWSIERKRKAFDPGEYEMG